MTLLEIIKRLQERYDGLGSEDSELITNMFDRMLEMCEEWPIDKTNRWIGFIQGVLFAHGYIEIDNERDFTRPLFHAYYEANGIEKPESAEVDNRN